MNPHQGLPDDAEPDELDELLSVLREELITEPQKKRLELLLRNEEAMDRYIRFTALHADLHQRLGGCSRSVGSENF